MLVVSRWAIAETAMRRHAACFVFSLAAAFAAAPDVASAQSDPFYKGKRLTLLINFAAGGPADIEGRLFARHFGKHIDGVPNIIVQNRDGAGGLVGTNYLGELGPRDGTMAGYLTAAAWNYVIDPAAYRVDFSTFEFVAYQPVNVVYYMRADTPPGMKDGAGLMRATGLVAGGLAADSSKDILIRLTLDMLGVPYKYVTGFRSSAPARLALQRGEINFFSESSPSYFSVVEPSIVNKGEAIAVWYDPIYDGNSFAPFKPMDSQGVPGFHEFYRKAKGTLPSGRLWDIYRTNLAVDSAMLRTVVLPPGTPPAAIEALRRATERLNNDPEFAQDAQKALQFIPHYVTGGDLNARVRRTLVVRPDIRKFVTDYIKNPPK
jgi:tripartite-type tricarboxylate transporter receptor subunit TctC